MVIQRWDQGFWYNHFSLFGLVPILCVSACCFFASAIMEVFICIPFEKKEAAGNILITVQRDLKESLHFMLNKQPVIWKISIIFAASNLLLTSLILIGLPVIITQYLGFDSDTANRLYGYSQGVIAAGAVLGGLLAGALSDKLNPRSGTALLIACSLCVFSGGVALQASGGPMISYLALTIGCGLLLALHTLFQIQMMTCLQLLTPKSLIGKVISCFMCAVMSTSPLGQIIYGLIFQYIGPFAYLPFYIAASIMIGIAVFSRHIFCGIDGKLAMLDSRTAEIYN